MSKQNPNHSHNRVSFPKSERGAHPGATLAGKTDPRRTISVSVIVKRRNPLDLEKLGVDAIIYQHRHFLPGL